MMNNQPKQTPKFQIGDEIGFVKLGQDIDEKDIVTFFPIVEVTTRDGEPAYYYQYPDGNISKSAIWESSLDHYTIKMKPRTNGMICLWDKKEDFLSALQRGLGYELNVYPEGFESDAFIVKNRTKQTQYRVVLRTIDGKAWAKCECQDFKYRKHLCKHVAEVMADSFFGVTESEGVVLNG